MFNLDHNMIPFAITLTMMAVIFIFGIVASMIIIKNKQNRKSREYMQALIDERERTMNSVSLEVHDNLTQMLSIAKMSLHLVPDVVLPGGINIVKQIGTILDTLIIDTRYISHALNADYLKKKGLLASLEEVAKWVNDSKKLDCQIMIEGNAITLNSQSKLMAFRIAQEAINNTIKFAEAQSVVIRLSYTGNAFQMMVTDDGIGFDNKVATFEEGIGMLSMRQRAKIVDGHIDIISTPDAGTSVILNIPNAINNGYAA
jgi:signal transduction histidine kinase